MDAQLLSKARWNSGILAALFAINLINAISEGRTAGIVLGVLATAFTIRDFLIFINAK